MRPIQTAASETRAPTVTVAAVDVETQPSGAQTQTLAEEQTAAAGDAPVPAKQPLYEVITQEQRMAIFLSVFISVFLSALDRTVVTTALPVIARDLNNQTLYAWVRSLCVSCLSLCLALILVLFCRLSRLSL